ncbi:hypothetical protein HDV00_000134 [Rhizophlyctis rosea]|nr:hypothetical protein HDV00_000134 [Rhizophlyctis rosea]
MGSFAVMVMAIFAYIADTTTQDQRTHTFVYVEASLFIALTAGPFCGGVLSRIMPQGVIGVFYIALVGKVLAFLYVAFLLPESFNPSPQIPAPASASNPNEAKLHGTFAEMKESLRGSLKLFSVAGPTGKATRIMLVIFFVIASAFGQFSVFFYYMVKMFKWDAYEEGVFMLVLSVARTAWMVGFFPWLMKRLINGVVPQDGPEQSERRVKVELIILRIALLVLVVGYLALGLATEDWMIYAITIADGFGTVTKPTLRGLLSRTVPAELQGRLFSGTQMVEQIGTLISGVVYPSLWASTVTKLPNGFFFLTSALYAVGFIMAVWLRSDGLYGLEHEIAPRPQDAATENDVLGAVVDEGEETGAI